MMNETLEQEVWRKAIEGLQGDLLRVCPSLVGAQKHGETLEQYARRGIAGIEKALERLAEAKEQYLRAGGSIKP